MNKQEVIERIGEANWDKFYDFMLGKYVDVVDNEYNYYEWDIKRFEKDVMRK